MKVLRGAQMVRKHVDLVALNLPAPQHISTQNDVPEVAWLI